MKLNIGPCFKFYQIKQKKKKTEGKKYFVGDGIICDNHEEDVYLVSINKGGSMNLFKF